MQKNQIDVGLSKTMPGLCRFFGSVDQSQIDHRCAGGLQLFGNALVVTRQLLFQAVKLPPVLLQANAEKTDAKLVRHIANAHALRRQARWSDWIQFSVAVLLICQSTVNVFSPVMEYRKR